MKLMIFTPEPAALQRERVSELADRFCRDLAVRGVAGGSVTGTASRLEPYSLATAPLSGAPSAPFLPAGAPDPRGLIELWVTERPDLPHAPDLPILADPRWTAAFAVREVVRFDAPSGASHDGHLVRLGFLQRVTGLDRVEFERHWTDVHGPLVLSLGPLFDRYVLNFPLGDGTEVDGIVQQCFPDRATMRQHYQDIVERKPAVLADLQRFRRAGPSFVATGVSATRRDL